jgi:UDP-GlcNAc:undecaprenyl-phosphate GlcNAc-1-phosphate transferase
VNQVSAYLANLGGSWGVHPLSTGAVAFVAGLVALLVCLNGRTLGLAAGLMDRPDGERKLHARETPLVGGVGVIAGIAVGAGYLAVALPQVGAFVGGSAAIVLAAFAIGLADDRDHVCPWRRLLSLAVLAAITVTLVPSLNVRSLHFDSVPLDVGLWWLSVPFTVFALLCLKNGLNMADGVDGLAPGIVLGWFALILPWAQEFAPEIVPIALVALVAMGVVFAFNWFGLVFLGDAGTYGLSFLAGAMAIHVYNSAGGGVPAELVALWFLIPVLDMGRLEKRAAVTVYLTLVVLPPAFATVEAKLLPFAVAASLAGYAALLAAGYRRPRRRMEAVRE